MNKRIYMTPLVAVVEIQGERLMGFADTSNKPFPSGAPALKRKVTSAY